jgi:hypothetical protein
MLSDKRTFDERPTAAELRQDEVAFAWNGAKNGIAKFAAACGVGSDAAEDIASELMGDLEEWVREVLDE